VGAGFLHTVFIDQTVNLAPLVNSPDSHVVILLKALLVALVVVAQLGGSEYAGLATRRELRQQHNYRSHHGAAPHSTTVHT